MAMTDYYVSVSGGATKTGTQGDPFDWATFSTRLKAGGSGQPGDRYNIQEGTYSLSGTDVWTIDGSATSPIVIRGCLTDWTPITPSRNSDNLLLDTTHLPAITYGAATYLAATGATHHVLVSLNFSSAAAAPTVYLGSSSVIFGCSVANTANNASARAIYVASTGAAINCDASCSGTSAAAAVTLSSVSTAIGCYVTDSPSYGIELNGTAGMVIGCVVSGCDAEGIFVSSPTTTDQYVIVGNTVYGCAGIGFADAAMQWAQIVVGNHITNSSGYAIANPNASAGPIILAYNRTRDNASGVASWAGDWPTVCAESAWGHVTETAGGATAAARDAAEFVGPTSTPKNLNLLYGAACRGGSWLPYMDIGALQRGDGTYPAEADVEDGVIYGPDGTDYVGTFVAPDASDVQSGVQYGGAGTEYTGTLTLAAATTAGLSRAMARLLERGEAVTYKPSSGGTRAIRAFVERLTPDLSNAGGPPVGFPMRVLVANDSTEGISSDELDVGNDQLSLPTWPGQSATDHRIAGRLDVDDEGMWLAVQ